MVIQKILNNNLVISQNEDGQEIILRGKGIGFQKKKGTTIPECEIERIFLPANAVESRHFQELISQIPIQYLTLSEQIVSYAREVGQLKLTDSVLLPLCDHIAGAVERFKSGIKLSNPMLWDIRRLYLKEFNVGLYAIGLMKERLNVDADEDEAAFLAYHFVNNQLNSSGMEDVQPITQLITEILSIIEQSYQIVLNKEDWNFQRFVTHLKFFAQRLLNRKQHNDGEDDFFYILKESYPHVYNCTVVIAEFLHDTYRYELNKEEMLYLMLHIERVTRKQR